MSQGAIQEQKQPGKPVIEEFRGERSKKLLKCSTEATAHMKEQLKLARQRATQGEPVFWTYIGVPTEILKAMDLIYFNPVNYGAVCSAKQMSRYYLDTLNTEGYFRDLCRYCTVALGYAFDQKPEIAPWGGLPRFTALIGFHQDDPCAKIMELFGKEFDAPQYYIDRPYMSKMLVTDRWWDNDIADAELEAFESHRVDVMVEEYEGLIRFLETLTGHHFSLSRLRDMIDKDNQINEWYWKGSDLACSSVPAPVSWTDALSSVAAGFSTDIDWQVAHAKKYHDEVEERVQQGLGACRNEKTRLMWEGHPLWFSLGFFNTWEESHGAVFLAMYYLDEYEQYVRKDITDPIRNLARRGATNWIWREVRSRIQWEKYVADKYKVDGAVYMVVESCKLLYTGLLFAREAMERNGIPTLEINADMVDSRDWDDTKMKSLMTSFIETLEA